MRTLPQTAGSSTTTAPAAPAPKPAAPHETDPAVAAALFAAWSGDPAVVVASPPGAGKTRLVVHLAEQLHPFRPRYRDVIAVDQPVQLWVGVARPIVADEPCLRQRYL